MCTDPIILRDTTSLRWRARVAKTSVAQPSVVSDDKKSKEVDTSSDGCCGTGLSWLDGVAAGAIGSSLLSVQAHSAVTKTASIATLVLGPYAAYQKRKLRLLGSLRKQQNILRATTNNFSVQNEVLHRKLARLDISVSSLEAVEHELALFASNETELNRLKHVVERQREIHAEMKKCLRKQILHDILDVVVHADRDRDFSVSPPEMEIMIVRMNALQGVQFHERLFRARMSQKDRSIGVIMRMIRNLMADDDVSNDIFTLCPQELVTGVGTSSETKEVV